VKRGLPLLALTQGDPAGIGPETLVKLVAGSASATGSRRTFDCAFLLVAEHRALDSVLDLVPSFDRDRLIVLDSPPDRERLEGLEEGRIAVLDPVGGGPPVRAGRSSAADAAGAIAAIDVACDLVANGVVDAMVTAPVSKSSIAERHLPGFVGHTDYIARRCGLERYGRDYLMAFLTPDLQVALLTTHLPLRAALESVRTDALVEALACLDRHAPQGRIAVAGLNPHAGEGGLLGDDESTELRPAVERARELGIDARGPESADSLFARARRGEFDWVLALYHDQGLIAVKTAGLGTATNWTLGLPFIRTSVDHGTAFEIAGLGRADAAPLALAVDATLDLISGRLPRRRASVR
jgi:4-hydroxythreonine-4-phosphate dehydrogenase